MIEPRKRWNNIVIWITILELVILYMSDRFPIIVVLQVVVLIGGVTSYKQIKESGERGKWLSVICIFLSSLSILNFLVSALMPAILY